MAGERQQDFLERQERQRQTFPELGVFNSPREQQRVDRLRLEENRPLTGIGQQIRDLYMLTEEDAAPRGPVFDRRRTVPTGRDLNRNGVIEPGEFGLDQPAPGASTSPFRLAEQRRFEEQQRINRTQLVPSRSDRLSDADLPGFNRRLLASELIPTQEDPTSGVVGGLALAGGVGSIADRALGAPIRGALQDRNPVRGAVRGFMDPQENANALNLPLINRLSDRDLFLGLSARDIAGGLADAALDVGVVGGLAKVGSATRFSDNIVRRTMIEADLPTFSRISNSTRAGVVPLRGGALSTIIDPPTISELLPTVRNSNNPVIRTILGRSGINPSLLEDSEIGRIGIAHLRARVASEGIIDTAIAATFDAHAQRGTGRTPFGRFGHIFKVDRDGMITNVNPKPGFENASRAWGDVLENPDRFDFTPRQQQFWDDIRQLIDEVEVLRRGEGLPPRERVNAPDGWFYVPRSVDELEGILKQGRMDPGRERTFMEMIDGMNNGVKYSTDLRAVLIAHLRGAYDEVLNHRLMEAVRPHTVPQPDGEFTRLPPAWLRSREAFESLPGTDHPIYGTPSPLEAQRSRLSGADDRFLLTDNNLNRPDFLSDAVGADTGFPAPNPTGQKTVTIYRAAPQDQQVILPGQYTTLSRAFAENHLQAHVTGRNVENPALVRGGHIISQQVNKDDLVLLGANELYWAPRDAYEATRALVSGQEQISGALRLGERIGVGTWRNQFLRREDADTLNRLVGQYGKGDEGGNWASRLFRDVGDAIRFHAAVGDFAAPFIQGLPVLAQNPVAWARATGLHYLAFLDPSVQGRFVRDHLDTYTEMARFGIPVGDVEFFTALENGRNVFGAMEAMFRRLPRGDVTGGVLRGAQSQSLGRFQSSYDTFLSTSRAFLWEGMRDSWVRRGGDGDSLARHIRNMTGGLDTRSLGVGAAQRQWESTWLAFSPRLLRSTVALGAEMLDPDPVIRGAATRNVVSLLGGISTLYVAGGVALGKTQEEIIDGLNPLNGKKFLSYEIDGDWIGLGGIGRSLTQLLTNVITQDIYAAGAAFGEDPNDIGGFLGKLTDEGSVFSPNFGDNSLARFYSSRGAPGVEVAGGLIEAGTGGKVDTLPFEELYTPADLAKHIGTALLPFAVQGHLEGESLRTSGASFLGARTSPQTPAERRAELLDAVTQPALGMTFEEFEKVEGRNSAMSIARALLKDQNPEALREINLLEEERLQSQRERAARGEPLAEVLVASANARDEIKDFIADNPTNYEAIRHFVSDQSAAVRAIREQEANRKALDELPESETEVEKDIDAYYELFDIEDPEDRDTAEAQFINAIGPERYQRVLRNVFAVTDDMPQQYVDLQETKLGLTSLGYFERDNVAWQAIQQQIGGPTAQFASFFEWRERAVEQVSELLRQQGEPEEIVRETAFDYVNNVNPVSKAVVDAMSSARQQLNLGFIATNWQSNPDLIANAVKFGYITTNRDLREIVRELDSLTPVQ